MRNKQAIRRMNTFEFTIALIEMTLVFIISMGAVANWQDGLALAISRVIISAVYLALCSRMIFSFRKFLLVTSRMEEQNCT